MESSNQKRLNHFFHIYAGADNWLLPVHQHFVTLNAYALMDNLESVQVGIIGSPEQRQAVIEHIQNNYQNPKIQIAVQRDSGYEGVTLQKLWEFSKENDGYLFYAHTKGTSRGGIVNQLWARSMLFFNVVRWTQAMKDLDQPGVDAVGCHYLCKDEFPEYFELYKEHHPNAYPFFAGNFWWAKAHHVRKLKDPLTDDKYSAEGWLGSYNISVIDMFKGMPSLNAFQNITF